MADPEHRILASWRRNARAWSEAVRAAAIPSRRAVTDAAIEKAVLAGAPRRVLDIGCGEGWLARRLSRAGIEVLGIDGVDELVQRAREAGGGDFRLLRYEDLPRLAAAGPFDCAVCNFSLLGDPSTRAVCAAIPRLLAHSGRFVIQTLHPGEPPEGEPDEGWREGSWSGFGREFSDPAPWYWRSVPAWERLLRVNGLEPGVVETPAYPDGTPASLLIVARPSAPSHD